MVDEAPKYQGKPTAYLDQNILDLFVDGDFQELLEKLISNFIIVYSDETLKEIKRSGDHSHKFLAVLKNLDAYHLKLILEQPEFKETDRATLTNRDPFEAFQEYCESVREHDDLQVSLEQLLYKFSGGNVGVGISEIHDDQRVAFSKLMDNLRVQLQETSGDMPDIDDLIDEYINEMTSKFVNALDETERMLKENIQDDRNWSGIKDLRKASGIGPKQPNNLKPPEIIRQIWEEYKDSPAYSSVDVSLEEFFGLKENPIFPDRPYFKHQKATGIYNMLNSLGYWPDKDVHKERRFIAAMSDNSHAAMASFCHVLFSRDEAFVKKVKAAYEYLEIPTSVQMVSVKNP